MRRFPPPPNIGGPSTPSSSSSSSRSKESPMQFEFTTPRTFPLSSFSVAGAGVGVTSTPEDGMNGIEEHGERAKKRHHHEAMDIDTPPPAIRNSEPTFPPSSTATSNPFHFSHSAPVEHLESLPNSNTKLSFDPDSFDPEEAFGLTEISMIDLTADDDPEEQVKEEEEEEVGERSLVYAGRSDNKSNTTETRRRKGVRKDKSPEGRRKKHRHEVDEDEEEEGEKGMGLGMGMPSNILGGRNPSNSEFSFQVHHHHGSNSDQNTPVILTERWLNRNTPYVLLGYLQFASLALLSILFLLISLLFLHTLYTDIQSRLASLTLEIRSEILQCAKAYVDNRCEPLTRIPAMERKCSGWEECMGRDIVVVGKTRVVAETLAEVVNGFVEVISFKTMLFVILTLGLTIYGSSIVLSNRSLSPPQTQSPYPYSSSPHIGPPHFQHLGYNYPPGYVLPPQNQNQNQNSFNGQGWERSEEKDKRDQSSMGLGAPPSASTTMNPQKDQESTKKGKSWF